MQLMEQPSPIKPGEKWSYEMCPMYVYNERTVSIGGSTNVNNTAVYALDLCAKYDKPVEFLFIGASAGQQASKIMGVFRYKIDEAFAGNKTAMFRPNRVRVKLRTPEGEIVDAICWEAFVVPTPTNT